MLGYATCDTMSLQRTYLTGWWDSVSKVLASSKALYWNCHFYRTDRVPGRKGATAVAVREGIPHNHIDIPSPVSVEATGVWYLLVITKYSMQLLEISRPGLEWYWRLWSPGFSRKFIFAGDLNDKYPLWNNGVSNLSGGNWRLYLTN
jgi:hypothetical protein